MSQAEIRQFLSYSLSMSFTSSTSDCFSHHALLSEPQTAKAIPKSVSQSVSQSQHPGSQNSQSPVNQAQAIHPPSFGVMERSPPVPIETASSAQAS